MSLHPDDAAAFWRSRIAPTDQFLVYAFDGEARSDTDPLTELRARAGDVPSLQRRIAPVPGDLDYPRWVRAPLDDAQFGFDDAARTWPECLELIARSMAHPLDARRFCWRVHVFGQVTGVPGIPGRGRVALVQVNHALGDGGRAAALARALFGGAEPPDARSVSGRHAATAALAGAAALPLRLGLGFVRGIRAGRWPAPPPGRAPVHRCALNAPAASPPGRDARALRTLVLPRDAVTCDGQVPVTAGVLAVLAEVLVRYLPDLAVADVVAETALARPRPRGASNSFLTVAVPLHPGEPDRIRRARRIGAEIAAARERDATPRRVAERHAGATTPAPLAALGVRLGAAAPPGEGTAGITFVSSVDRGPADLTLCGGSVVFTAGFPALSSSYRLTHGVHGIGRTITISLLADPAAVDVDRYLALLRAAFG